jgi:hypothetical protein
MALVSNNIFLRGLTGSLGKQFVIRKTRSGKTIVANVPTFEQDREFSEAQLNQQNKFGNAIAYAVKAQHDPYYQEKAANSYLSAYNIAIQDYARKPGILDIDASRWTGKVGQQIHIRAKDDCKVTQVRLVIRPNSEDYDALDGGEAVQSETDGLLWVFTTTTPIQVTPGMLLDAYAYDLPGHMTLESVTVDQA